MNKIGLGNLQIYSIEYLEFCYKIWKKNMIVFTNIFDFIVSTKRSIWNNTPARIEALPFFCFKRGWNWYIYYYYIKGGVKDSQFLSFFFKYDIKACKNINVYIEPISFQN